MEKLLTAQELSDYLQVALFTVRKWCHYDYVPYLRVGGFVRVKASQIEKWIKLKERQGRSTYSLKL